MIVVLAEKPSVARDIAVVLGARERKSSYLEGNGYQVTWAIGHLVGLPDPASINPEWGDRRRAENLPMLPPSFPLAVLPSTRDQFEVIRKLFTSSRTKEIICATDAGREGELIFRFIYEASCATKPVRRLWISSLTPSAIQQGMQTLKPAAAYDALASAARARSVADWLVGMNLSRAYTLAVGRSLSIGRVQTPTLAMIVKRDVEIARHEPEFFQKVRARFEFASQGPFDAFYERQVEDKQGMLGWSSRLPPRGGATSPIDDAEKVLQRLQQGATHVKEVARTEEVTRPPKFYDLSELQRDANRLWGWTASDTLQVAQELYEKHKLLSYPRTDSRHISTDVAATLPQIVAVVRDRYDALLVPETGRAALSKQWVDDAKVSDHHAILPTTTEPRGLDAESRPGQLYDLVVRRLLQAWQPDHITSRTKVVLELVSASGRDRYVAEGTTVVRAGWKALALQVGAAKEEVLLPLGLVAGARVALVKGEITADQTKPRAHYTEATLLKAMETAGRDLSPEQAEAMKERGLGTPATRAATIEKLVERAYIVRDGKALKATPEGAALIERVHAYVRDPGMTGEWELRLRQIERGQGSADSFLDMISSFVTGTVRDALKGGVAPRAPYSAPPGGKPRGKRAPKRKSGTLKVTVRGAAS